uniref:Putative RNA binding protein n=1 Tax=Trypanosoma congolense (strain IL3000) TaxID=1068625 RepID=G0UYN3_TRYCI|nr:putative RNA binding protein [Trypanosoma congolense IL3000]
MHTGPHGGASDATPLLWSATKELQEGFNSHCRSLPQLLGIVHNLERTLESTRLMYNNVIKQRDEARNKLIAIQSSLAAVERIVEQYAAVSDPVVASDGFTYENALIREYLRDCANSRTKAYSQLTKEELLDVLVPNQTLLRLVQMLKHVHPPEVPAVSVRAPIMPLTPYQLTEGGEKGMGGNLKWAGSEHDSVASPLRVSELEASLVSAANASGIGKGQGTNSHSNNSSNNNNNNSNGSTGRRWEGRLNPSQQQQLHQQTGGFAGKNIGRKHPCLRVYGRCNFLDDCAFANYPYEACLNYIKGKCRFGQHCKELHVSAIYPRHSDQRGGGGSASNNNNNSETNSGVTTAANLRSTSVGGTPGVASARESVSDQVTATAQVEENGGSAGENQAVVEEEEGGVSVPGEDGSAGGENSGSAREVESSVGDA